MRIELENPWDAKDPEIFFQSLLVYAMLLAVGIQLIPVGDRNKVSSEKASSNENKPGIIRRIKWKFLSVFWLLRIAFWMNGPYLQPVLASKEFNGKSASVSLISKFVLMQFAALPLFGALIGRFMDRYGSKIGTIVGAISYAAGALSLTTNNSLFVIFAGRCLAGLGAFMMSNGPENWLISTIGAEGQPVTLIGSILGSGFAFDPIVAVAAGELAEHFADYQGPTAPFQVAPVFLGIAAGLVIVFWGNDYNEDRTRAKKSCEDSRTTQTTWSQMKEVLDEIRANPKILYLGCVQCFFEASMQIFVMKFPPILNAAVKTSFGHESQTPYGTIFSCFMASCLVGSTIVGKSKSRIPLELSTIMLLLGATLSMTFATMVIVTNGQIDSNASSKLWQLTMSFIFFETCVGAYFQSFGALRNTYMPNKNRAMFMTMVQIPLNIIVAVVFLVLHKLGDSRTLGLTSIILMLATICMTRLWVLKKRADLAAGPLQKLRKGVKRLISVQKHLSELKITRRGSLSQCETFSQVPVSQSLVLQLLENIETQHGKKTKEQ